MSVFETYQQGLPSQSSEAVRDIVKDSKLHARNLALGQPNLHSEQKSVHSASGLSGLGLQRQESKARFAALLSQRIALLDGHLQFLIENRRALDRKSCVGFKIST